MPALTSISLVLAMALAVTLGPRTQPWSWGPAMVALGFSVITSIPNLLKRDKTTGDLCFVLYAVTISAWYALRAWTSPVHDLAESDLLLLASAIGFYLSTRAITNDSRASNLFLWGIALLLLSNLVVMGVQFTKPTFTPIFLSRDTPRTFLQGFFGHYNENANFLIAASMFVSSGALFARAPAGIRMFWGLVGFTGIVAVWYTRSRGGILAAAIAVLVFAIIALIIAKRQNKRWFAHGVIALPVVGIISILFLMSGWQSAQKERHKAYDIEDLMDNDIRLYMIGMAMDAIRSDTAIGGGSRSFSWDCFQLWDEKSYGKGGSKPEMVHHELLQAATDYGVIGACLMFGLLVGSTFTVFLRTIFDEQASGADTRHLWRLGGLSALVGMFVQSNFSFVFHLLPGVALFGICIAGANWTQPRSQSPKTVFTGLLLIASSVFCLWNTVPAAWSGSLVMKALWPSHYGKEGEKTLDSKVSSLDESIQLWPRHEFYLERAMILQQLAATPENPDFESYAKRGDLDYEVASRLHPYAPEIPINRANLLSLMGRTEEAEALYREAISLQGQMEAAFRAHFYYSQFLLGKSHQLQLAGNLPEAISTMEIARDNIESAIRLTPDWIIGVDGRNLRISIHERIGIMLEATGDREGALASYNFASSIHSGNRAHYRAAVLIGRMGRDDLARRRAPQALYQFIEARKRIDMASGEVPAGVSPTDRQELTSYLDQAIALLKAAKFTPQK